MSREQPHDSAARTDSPTTIADSPGGSGGGPAAPRQLPLPPVCLIGRSSELRRLEAAVQAGERVPTLFAVEGPAGVGKSALALYWAHRHTEHFPDGQLYADLGGFNRSGNPAEPLSVLQGFLGALGVPAPAVPATQSAAAALFRSIVADRKMLLVLDNAADAEQIEPLLPGTASCIVIMTSRSSLASLLRYGTESLRLDVLSAEQAKDLFIAMAGYAVAAAAPDEVATLTNHCGGLPLALTLVAARVLSEPDASLTELADEITSPDRSLDVFDIADGSTNLEIVLSWSCRSLSRDEVRLFWLLGAAPVDEFEPMSVAALLAVPHYYAAKLLRSLAAKNLVRRVRARTYNVHQLVRRYAGQLASEAGSRPELDDAKRRLVDFYVRSALAADRRLYPFRSSAGIGVADRHVTALSFDTDDAALQWFDDTHRLLTMVQRAATEQDLPEHAWLLSRALDTYQYRVGLVHDNVASGQLGLAAARRLGSLRAQVLAGRQLGRALTRAGDFDHAYTCLEQALQLAQSQEIAEQAHTHHDLARVYAHRGDHAQALHHSAHAASLYHEVGNTAGRAHALGALARQYADIGEYDKADEHAHEALTLHEANRNVSGRIVALDTLGYIAECRGMASRAAQFYAKARELSHAQGNTYFEAEVIEHLAHAQPPSEGRATAAELLRQAHRLYRTQHRHREAERVAHALADLELRASATQGGQPAPAHVESD